MRRRIRKGLAMLLTATMVVGLMPGAGTIKVSAAEGEASVSAATAEGYDANGFCTGYKFDEFGKWVKDESSSSPCTHEDCNGYQPANKTTGTHEVDGDSNTQDEVYEISNAGQLYWFADKINNENATYKNINAVLTKDITVNESVLSDGKLNEEKVSTFRSWTPIGYYISDSDDRPYTGIFDGQENTISGLYFSDSNKSYVGLFGESYGKIKRVNITDSYFNGNRIVGGICGYNTGTIEDSNNIDSFVKSGNVNDGNGIGGVCGSNTETGGITNCNNTGEVQGSSNVGGVCGRNSASVKNCSNSGNVTATGQNVGGVCGYFASGSLENSYNTGDVQGSSNIGGICGNVYSSAPSIKNCYYKTKEANSLAAIGKDSGGYKIYVEGKTSEQFSNGVVAYLLNSRSAEDSPVWYQNIDNGATPDTAPVLDSSHGTVYASKPCPVKCSNTESTVSAESQSHSFGDDNICTVCGAKGEIIDDPTLIEDVPSMVDGVYQLETERQFYYFVALVNGRLVGVNQDTSANAVLKTDITVNDNVLDEDGTLVSETGNLKTWVPIGYSDGVSVQTYTGTFDGGGHTISGLYFDDKSISYVGLFGSSTGTIKNVKVVDSYFKGDTYVGGICGKNEGNIEGCEVSGKVEANNKYADFGGICGYNGTGYVKNCKSTVDISHPIHFTYPNGGGIVGQNDGTIENCHNIGELNLIYTNGETAGGICGKNNTSGVIKSCYNTGTVYSKENSGGICGTNSGRISDCYNTGSCRASTTSLGQAGGICGSSSGSITNCYSTGNVTGYYTGKICGNKSSGVTNCYYQDSSESDSIAGTTFKEATQFASGEVAYLLNEGKTDNDVVWRQTLTGEKDTIPVLDSEHGIVYASKPCVSDFSNAEITYDKQHNYQISTNGAYHQCSYCKKTEQHADVATFTVDEANHSITAICPSGCELGTITLSASGETYDGTEKSHVSGEIKGFTPTIVYEKKAEDGSFEKIESAPKDAGTYRASITYTVDAEKGKVYTVSTEYTIARRPVTITANNENKTYGNPDPTLSYNVSDNTPLVYGETLNGTLSREEGDNAGTYKITQGTVTNDGNPNYDITFNEGTLTIDKANTNGTANCEMVLQYDETSGRYTATIGKVDKAEYRFDNGEWSSENTLTGIAHGTQVTGYIRIAGDDNHNPGAESSKTLTSGHGTLTHYAAKAADCVNDGNVEYWYCESCGKYFSDADGKTETTKDAVTIKATGHTGYDEDGVCDTCSAIVDAYKHLQTLITSVKDIEQGDYSDASLQAFTTALAAAQKHTAESTAEELTAAYEALDNAYKGLKPYTFIVGTVANPSDTGKQTGGGRYAVGETVTLTAEGVEGWTFNGWYDSDKLISDKAEVTFTVTEGMSGPVAYTAKYTHVSHTMNEETHKCNVCETDYYKVTFTYEDNTTTEVYTTGNVEFPAGDYIFKVGNDVIDTSDYIVSADTEITVESLAEATKCAVTITGDAHCTVTVTDSNGNTVVNGDTVAAGTILKVSVKVDDGYTLTTPPASSYTVNEATTITAVTQAKTYAVTVDNTYYQNSEAEAPTASVTDLSAVPYGTSLTLTAADANTGYEFLGWYQTNGKQLTAQKEYTVTITSALTVQPRYQQNSGTVTFVANGRVIDTIENATESTEIVFPSNVDTHISFEFTGWDKTEEQIHAALASGENVIVTALFEQVKANYTVTIYNAEETNADVMNLTESKAISVTAKEVAGKNFAYWLLDGEIQSYNKTISFFVTDSCTLKAVYSVDATQALGTALIKSGSYDISTHKLTVLGYMTVPSDGCKIVSAGLYAASANSDKYNANDELTSANADYVKVSTKAVGTAGPLSYTWTKTNVNAGDIWYVRPYIIYTDEENKEHTVYGERITLCAGTEYNPAEKATAKIDGISYDSTSLKAKFVAYLAVPENAVIQKAGLVAKSQVAGFDPDTEILSANNAQYVKSSTLAVGTNGPVSYTWTKTNVNTGDTWYVRAYLVYTDKDGIEHTVYGNLLKYTAQ